jgi:hypothetical protein
MVLMDSIHDAGKMCHAVYMLTERAMAGCSGADAASEARAAVDSVDYGKVRDYIKTDEFGESWRQMDAFTRASNYVAAIHDPVKRKLLLAAGMDVRGMTASENAERYAALPEEIRERLQEIEHIRWSRYHLLNYWKKPDEAAMESMAGKRKDPVNKLHTDLVPYGDLSRAEKDKDAYFYKTIALRTV